MVTWSKRISNWAIRTFGRANPHASYNRFLTELEEFQKACSGLGTREQQAEEAADIVITLCRFCDAIGYDLATLVYRKEFVNSQREWKSHGDGTGQHIKDPELDKWAKDRFDAFRATDFDWFNKVNSVQFYVKEQRNAKAIHIESIEPHG